LWIVHVIFDDLAIGINVVRVTLESSQCYKRRHEKRWSNGIEIQMYCPLEVEDRFLQTQNLVSCRRSEELQVRI